MLMYMNVLIVFINNLSFVESPDMYLLKFCIQKQRVFLFLF